MLLSITGASYKLNKLLSIIMPIALRRSASVESVHNPAKRLKTEPTITKPSSEHELVEAEMALPIEYGKAYNRELDYREKLVLAPMVRTGTRTCKMPFNDTETSPHTIAVPSLRRRLGVVTRSRR